MQLILQLPPRESQLAFNRRRWEEVLADPELAALPHRIETNRHGNIVLTASPDGRHSDLQGEITYQLRSLLGGKALPECPISTVNGVRAADVGWYSETRFDEVRDQVAFETAPEICVEILSPSNTDAEMADKKQLYFEAGAREVWLCTVAGDLQFFLAETPSIPSAHSTLCPEFPPRLDQ